MAKDTKFGMFGGVFTPSLLTILGVIMYLRLPWVMGQAGLWTGLGIILVAHVVSIATGLSISSIATDKKVGTGGAYYIVSRSLGLPIGGTLGLALFLGLAFSISFYIIGFCESCLAVLHIDPTPDAIRIAGTITLVVLTVITLISTALAIKTQYVILGAIALSLVSIFLGSPDVPPEHVHTAMREDAPSLAVLFSIFFPAVTGFTAGVNMSGDLRDPKGAIPSGTMLSIAAGLVVYVALGVFLAYRVPADDLVGNYNILYDIALFPPAVVAGIWGATLSSALGCILGAPRILQATAVDGIVPRVFAKGVGKANEPRNALVLAFAIGLGGILIAKLDAIAGIVSMVFLTTYGFFNLCCAIESWVSPDFRPTFRIPRFVSILGAATSILLMIQLDMLAMTAATLVMGGLYAYLQRRQLRLESGDAWEGVWTSVVRAGLYRLRTSERQQRNWRPNILVFARHGADDRGALRRLATTLISGNGMATELEVYEPGSEPSKAGVEDDDPGEVGFFRRELEAEDFFGAAATVVQHHGFGTLEPNAVLLDWNAVSAGVPGARKLFERLARRDLNLLLFAPDPDLPPAQGGKRIDVWWRPGAGNLPLCVSLVRFVTRAAEWRNADVRFLLLADEHTSGDYLRAETYRFLDDRRVGGSVRVVNSASGGDDFDDRVRGESADAELVIVGLPELANPKSGQSTFDDAFFERLDRLQRDVGNVLYFRAEAAFEPVLRVGRAAEPTGEIPPEGAEALEQRPLTLPEPPALASAAQLFSDHHDELARELDKRGITPLYERNLALVAELRSLLEKNFDTLKKRLAGANVGKHENVVNRVQSAFLLDAERVLAVHREEALPDQRSRLAARADAFLFDGAFRPAVRLRVSRPKADFEAKPRDDAHVRAFKQRQRILGMLTRAYGYTIEIEPLVRFYRARVAEEVLLATLSRFATDSHAVCVQVGKLLNSSKTSLALLGERFEDEASVEGFVEKQRAAALARVDELRVDLEERRSRAKRALFAAVRVLAQRYADDLDRLDLARVQKRERRIQASDRESQLRIAELPDEWLTAQSMLVERAEIGLKVSTFQHRLATIVHRAREDVRHDLECGVLSMLVKIEAALERWRGAGAKGRPTVAADLEQRFDPKPIVERFVRETTTLSAGLPDTTTTLSDESIRELALGRCEELQTRRISARGVAELLMETELVSHVQRELEAVPLVEERAASVARDVVRLVGFNLGEAAELEEEGAESQMRSVVDTALERLGAEIRELGALGPRLDAVFVERLERLIDGTDPYELTRSSDKLTRELRKVGGKKAIRGIRGRAGELVARMRELMVYLLYRRSVGLLYARRLEGRATSRGPTVDRLTSFVSGGRPRPEVIEALPFFYRQLFLGQSAVHKSFWVERPDELRKAREAIARHDAGAHGAILVTGERLSGKSALLHRISQQALGGRSVHWVHSLPAGSASPADLVRSLREATRLDGDVNRVLSAAPRPIGRGHRRSRALVGAERERSRGSRRRLRRDRASRGSPALPARGGHERIPPDRPTAPVHGQGHLDHRVRARERRRPEVDRRAPARNRRDEARARRQGRGGHRPVVARTALLEALRLRGGLRRVGAARVGVEHQGGPRQDARHRAAGATPLGGARRARGRAQGSPDLARAPQAALAGRARARHRARSPIARARRVGAAPSRPRARGS